MTARHLLKRAVSLLVTLLVASVGIFGLLRLVPGSTAAAVAGPDATLPRSPRSTPPSV